MDHLHTDPIAAHELYLQWHTKNFFPPDSIVAVCHSVIIRRRPGTTMTSTSLPSSSRAVASTRVTRVSERSPGSRAPPSARRGARVPRLRGHAGLQLPLPGGAHRRRAHVGATGSAARPTVESGRSAEPGAGGPQTFVDLDPATARRFIDTWNPSGPATPTRVHHSSHGSSWRSTSSRRRRRSSAQTTRR